MDVAGNDEGGRAEAGVSSDGGEDGGGASSLMMLSMRASEIPGWGEERWAMVSLRLNLSKRTSTWVFYSA